MDYRDMAAQLLRLYTQQLQIPTSRRLAQMEHGQLCVLDYLLAQGRQVHPKELSERLSVSSARIAALLNHMEDKGLIRRLHDPQDSRQILVVLTEAGRESVLQTRERILAQTASLLEALGPEDARAYLRIQEKLLDAMASQRR